MKMFIQQFYDWKTEKDVSSNLKYKSTSNNGSEIRLNFREFRDANFYFYLFILLFSIYHFVSRNLKSSVSADPKVI